MSKNVVIGIDTSNYTTSLAILGTDGTLLANIKRLLPVAEGQCGLRQSDALFAHIRNLPELLKQAGEYLSGAEIVSVGVSTRPRNVEGSYMPVFLAGLASAEAISLASGAKIHYFSHQCGHIRAALYSSGREDLIGKSFGAVHASGGTTELVRVSPSDKGFSTEIVGGTLDLNAGQVVDRIGVMLGMPFPSGPHLEKAALRFSGKVPKKKISISGMHINLSGLENMARTLYQQSGDSDMVAAFVFDYLSRAFCGIIKAYNKSYGDGVVVCAGGVMCNSIVKSNLAKELDVCFAEPALSSDNAVGVAALALDAYLKENK